MTLADRIAAEAPHLLRYATVLTRKNGFDREDLVQNALVRALDKQHLFQEGTNLRSWLMTILHNQFVNMVRHSSYVGNGVSVNVERYEPELTVKPTQERGALLIRDLKRALDRLPELQRRSVLLVGQRLKYDDIAVVEDVPVGTIRSRVARGRAALHEFMDGSYTPRRVGRGART